MVSGMSELTDSYNKSRVWLAFEWQIQVGFMKLLIRAITFGNADKATTYHELISKLLYMMRKNVKSVFRTIPYYTCTRRLPMIQHPMLLIYGQKDLTFHPYAKILHNGLPHSSLFFIKDAKHPIPIKNATKMNDLIRLWVESLEDRSDTAWNARLSDCTEAESGHVWRGYPGKSSCRFINLLIRLKSLLREINRLYFNIKKINFH